MEKRSSKLKNFYNKHRKKILTAVRIIVSIGLISYLLFFGSGFKDFSNFIDLLKTINIPLLIASTSMHIFGIWISVVRWNILLKTQKVRISQGYLASSFLIGTFFNNLLPTSIGGDIFRTVDIANKAKISAGKSASVIVIERFSGVISAATYAVIALFLGFTTVGTTSYIIPVVAFFAVSVIFMFLILNPAILRLNRLVDRMKFLSKIREKLREVYHTFQSFKKYKLALFETLLCSFALQIGIIANYYLASRAMGIDLPFAAFIFIVPVVATIAMLPISIGGIGIRENSLVFLMTALGATSDKATVVSLVIFAQLLLLGIIGAIVYVVRPFVLKQPLHPEKELSLDTTTKKSIVDLAEKEEKK